MKQPLVYLARTNKYVLNYADHGWIFDTYTEWWLDQIGGAGLDFDQLIANLLSPKTCPELKLAVITSLWENFECHLYDTPEDEIRDLNRAANALSYVMMTTHHDGLHQTAAVSRRQMIGWMADIEPSHICELCGHDERYGWHGRRIDVDYYTCHRDWS